MAIVIHVEDRRGFKSGCTDLLALKENRGFGSDAEGGRE
jgi:hypothetical protein